MTCKICGKEIKPFTYYGHGTFRKTVTPKVCPSKACKTENRRELVRKHTKRQKTQNLTRIAFGE